MITYLYDTYLLSLLQSQSQSHNRYSNPFGGKDSRAGRTIIHWVSNRVKKNEYSTKTDCEMAIGL